ncbi:MAG: HEAT repeat domain-containing protein [Desulfobacterales bacterium]
MYPEHHVVYKESLQKVISYMDAFLKKHSDLKLDVEKNQLLFEEEPVYRDDPKTGEWAYPLYRDGIQWLEFQAGLELGEISEFVKIVNQYRKLQEEPKGDLVTALWEKDFPHLQYAATDILWRADTVKDFSTFNMIDHGESAAGNHGVEGAAFQGTEGIQEAVHDDMHDSTDTAMGQRREADINLAVTNRTIWEMTPEELQHIEEMVAEEETQKNTEDVLDVLQLILMDQSEKEDFSIVLEFIKEEFKNTLAQGEFRIAHDFLENLKKACQSCKSEKPWVESLLNRFLSDITDVEVLGVLKDVLPSLEKQHVDQVTVFRKLLLNLPSSAVTVLGPMLLENISASLERQIMEIVGSLAIKDIQPLERLLDRPEEALVKKLVYILGYIKKERAVQILIKMTGHPSSWVRMEALKGLKRRNKNMVNELLPLINDPVLPIRRMIWDHIEAHQNEDTGELILDFLEQRKIFYRTDKQILNCYRALGRCGTPRSIPLLRQTLLGQTWQFNSERSLRRRGAALALLELNTEEARNVLHDASRSLFPNIRSAYQKALKDHQ